MINERRDFFRIEDKVLLRCLPVDESSVLADRIPAQFNDDSSYSLMRDLQHIDQENNKFLRAIAEHNRELEIYLKAMNKKIELIASRLVENLESADDQQSVLVSLSEGGLAFHSVSEYPHDSYLALQLTLLPSHISLILFAKVINSSLAGDGQMGTYATAVSFIHLKDSDRQIIAKHIMQLQLMERRRQSHEDS